jgi:hypothetical protein
VYTSKNLVVNNDGSVSLRKPLILKTKFKEDVRQVIPLQTGDYLVLLNDSTGTSFGFVNSALVAQDYYVSWHDVYGNKCVNKLTAGTRIPSTQLDISNCTPIPTANGVVLGNCLLSHTVEDFPGTHIDTAEERYSVVDAALYDNTVFSERILNVYYSRQYDAWYVQVHSAEPNTHSLAESGFVLEANTFLDNPFAARDSYDVAVPAVKDIRAYVYSTFTGQDIVPTGNLSQVVHTQSAKMKENVNVVSARSVKGAYRTESPSNETRREYYKHSASGSGTVTYLELGNVLLKADLSVSDVSFECMKNSFKNPSGNYDTEVWYALRSASIAKFTLKLYVERKSSSVDYTQKTNFKIRVPAHTFTASLKLASNEGGRTKLVLGQQSLAIPLAAFEIDFKTFANGSTHVMSTSEHVFRYDVLQGGASYTSDDVLWMFDRASAFEVSVNVGVASTTAVMSYIEETTNTPENLRVVDLTESVKTTRFRAAELMNFEKCDMSVLKVFLNIPTSHFEPLYGSWRYSLDGVTWYDALYGNTTGIRIVEPSQDPIENVADNTTASDREYRFVPFNPEGLSFEDVAKTRPDCLFITKNSDAWGASVFKFKLCTVDTSTSKVKATYGESLFYSSVGRDIRFEETDLGNFANAARTYSKSRLYSYGTSALKNCILYTYPGEFNAPMSNVIELSASADESVTALVRWRDALISATESALYLSESQGDAFYTRVLNTAVGIPKEDSKCCVPILNGVLFKSGTKVYQLYPNVYSDDGTVLNVTDVSQNVAHYLEDYTSSDEFPAFAFSTETEYVLALPNNDFTRCLRYNYDTRVWTCHEYGVIFKNVQTLALNDIRVWGTLPNSSVVCEFMFDASFQNLPFTEEHARHLDTLPYGDILTRQSSTPENAYGTLIQDTVSEIVSYFHSGNVNECVDAISFELDTGQKSDTISTTKQFVESKLVFATVHGDDAFPMQLTVHIDGDPHIVTKDISTDASFWKDNGASGVLNTTFNGLSSMSDSFNTLRQLVVRYSGKGKSIRHILTGKSLCNFKLYETYIRYKLLNVKQ